MALYLRFLAVSVIQPGAITTARPNASNVKFCFPSGAFLRLNVTGTRVTLARSTGSEEGAMNDTVLATWAAQQPLTYKLVNERLVFSAERHQAPSRLAALRHIAKGVFGNLGQVDAWLALPSPDLAVSLLLT